MLGPNQKPCPKCGGPMHRQSPQCRECYLKGHLKPRNYVTKPCPVCGIEFTVHQVHIKRGQGKYCGRACARSGSPTRKRTRKLITCYACGRRFEKHLSEIKKNVGTMHFCSPDCWYKHNQRENHYGWEGGQHERQNPEGREWRQKVLERDCYFCRLCYSQSNLEAHHIKRFATHPELRWKLSNGLTLCHGCHVQFRNEEEDYEEILSFITSVPIEVWYA